MQPRDNPTHLAARVLIIHEDAPLGDLYAQQIDTHCRGVRIDRCGPTDHALIDDNAGGADLAIISIADTPLPFETLRRLLTLRPCLPVLALVPASRPGLADAAIRAGAADVLLCAPGYLEQLAATTRKNVLLARARLSERAQIDRLTAALRASAGQIAELKTELASPALPRPVVTIRPALARAA